MIMALQGLLEALCKADPKYFIKRPYSGIFAVGASERPCFPSLHLQPAYQDVEYALREAIEARGWRWDMHSDSGDYDCVAIVHTPQCSKSGEHNIPCIALGMAYLEALEGQQ